MKTLTKKSALAFFAAASLACLSTTASAGDVSVRFHASDLGAPSALYERLAQRAEAACKSNGRQGLWRIRAEQACAADLLDQFVAGAASPALSAVHDQSGADRLAGLR